MLKLCDLSRGMLLICKHDCDCFKLGDLYAVNCDKSGDFYTTCCHGQHFFAEEDDLAELGVFDAPSN